jgi:hypothetical protein
VGRYGESFDFTLIRRGPDSGLADMEHDQQRGESVSGSAVTESVGHGYVATARMGLDERDHAFDVARGCFNMQPALYRATVYRPNGLLPVWGFGNRRTKADLTFLIP